MKKNKISKNWINKQKKNIYVRKSKIEGYRSRAAYKLQEIQEKYRLIKNGMSIVDLGAAPGSWSEYMSRKFKNTNILSIDIKEMQPIENTFQIIGDFTHNKNKTKILEYFNDKIDLVVSDMAVNTTGNKNVDSLVTGELSMKAMNFSIETLKKNGVFISKIFMGTSFNEIVELLRRILRNFMYTNPFKQKRV